MARSNLDPAEILEDNIGRLIDNPLLKYSNTEADRKAVEFAIEYGFGHMRELFVKASRILRDPPAWRGVPDLTCEEYNAQRREESRPGFWQQPKALRVTIITLCIAAVIQGWNQTGSNGANLNWPEEFGLHVDPSDPRSTTSDIAIFALVNSITYFAASLIGCWFSDSLNEYFYGRRAAICISGVFIFASVIGGACTHSWGALLATRILLGIGMGSKASVVPVYAAEVAPVHIRGSLVMNWQLFDAFGIFCGFTANLAVSQIGPLAWRFQTASSFLPALILLALIFVCPESPRYLMKRGRSSYVDAFDALVALRGSPILAAKELYYVHSQIGVEQTLLSHYRRGVSDTDSEAGSRSRRVGYSTATSEKRSQKEQSPAQGAAEPSRRSFVSGIALQLGLVQLGQPDIYEEHPNCVDSDCHPEWREKTWKDRLEALKPPPDRPINYWQKLGQLFTERRIRRATVSAVVVMISQQLCGVNIVAFYSSTLFRDANADRMGALWLSWGIGLANFLFAFPAYWLIDPKGRRFLLLITTPALGLTMLAAGLSFLIDEENPAHVPVISLFFFIFFAFYSWGMGPVPFTLSAEVFPLENRVVGMSFAVFVNLFGAGVLALIVPLLTSALGHILIFCIFAILNAVAFFLIFFFVRETAGAVLGGTPEEGSINYVSLEELNYIFGVSTKMHSAFQIEKFKSYFTGDVSKRRTQLYVWALDRRRTQEEQHAEAEGQGETTEDGMSSDGLGITGYQST
ncbi:major facilitator superfamily domain-containing protein [Lineolata rhizophorae]|uniref:Major facilitator superfamily domain-containing protein n=1 Tax=Lineolata rhizophorae TaxID=578093 RepID=A0A6A6P5J9_9PEZI|nr:major facilitator superfamily domain-containing protein [Lineolata rhizophorae]